MTTSFLSLPVGCVRVDDGYLRIGGVGEVPTTTHPYYTARAERLDPGDYPAAYRLYADIAGHSVIGRRTANTDRQVLLDASPALLPRRADRAMIVPDGPVPVLWTSADPMAGGYMADAPIRVVVYHERLDTFPDRRFAAPRLVPTVEIEGWDEAPADTACEVWAILPGYAIRFPNVQRDVGTDTIVARPPVGAEPGTPDASAYWILVEGPRVT